ncbi:MAG: hypothetical protein LBK99_00685 [Opitutaceae bacterium]|nr:hypothetical protein [Opitutaceae bacterium]
MHTRKKNYPGDIGLRNALRGYRSQDTGIQLECVVCQHLLAGGWDVTVGRWGELEIDFVAERDSSRLYLQVAYLMSDESTLARDHRNAGNAGRKPALRFSRQSGGFAVGGRLPDCQ